MMLLKACLNRIERQTIYTVIKQTNDSSIINFNLKTKKSINKNLYSTLDADQFCCKLGNASVLFLLTS